MNILEYLRKTNLSRVEKWHPGFPYDEEWTIADWANAMQGESGEAGNVVKKIRRIDSNFNARPSERNRAMLIHDLGYEIADIILYCDLLAAKVGIDLWPYIVEKFNKTSEEYGWEERLKYDPFGGNDG
jgi:NTP pyrophosphatase (non-canonical NTP hydrolase)